MADVKSDTHPIVDKHGAAGAGEPRRHVLGEARETLLEWLTAAGEQRYRVDQIFDWIYNKHAQSFDEMSNLSKKTRAWLSAHADLYRGEVIAEPVSEDGTLKLLSRFPGEALVETVWIPDRERNTVCISSQVGCPVGCRFCASGMGGVQRNLTAGEIVEQVMRIRRRIADRAAAGELLGPDRVTNIVFMGMGEPLANYDEVLQAIRIINADWGGKIGARRITVSTVGLPKQIRHLAEEGLQISLALSLHAPNQRLREELIPWGRVPLDELLDACGYYFERTGREITLEYILLDSVNMEQAHAAQLAKICRRLRCNVNLLRYNPVPGLPFGRPSAETAYQFQQQLRELGVNAHIRTSRGRDIDAACGQLRRRAAGEGSGGAEGWQG